LLFHSLETLLQILELRHCLIIGIAAKLGTMVSWQTPLCPFTIDFDPAKLEEIRTAVLSGFYTVPRGGIEIGGVLYGTYTNGRLTISGYLKIETEYLTGPGFELSENDCASLKKLLEEAKPADPKLRPAGWFRSRTRTDIHLSEKDLELYREFFPEPWQVALVLKPDRMGGTQCGYFFRDPDGEIKADACVKEFPLWPYAGPKTEAAEPFETPAPEPVLEEPTESPEPAPRRRRSFLWQFVRFTLLGIILAGAAVLVYWVATH
jgi:hypothetical protein